MKALTHLFVTFLLLIACVADLHAQAQDVTEINGIVLDEASNDPIPYANIYIKDTFQGTVSNSSGEFSFKVPSELQDGILVVSSIGYKAFEKPVREFSSDENKVYLTNVAYVLQEVVVPNIDLILVEALKRIPENYPTEYLALTTFYREIIKKNRSYVDISQGILNISKAPYIPEGEDQISIHKGHRVQNYKRMDTLAFKVMGGPNTMMMLDIVKNPGSVLGREYMEMYDYKYGGIQVIDGRRSYVLRFKQKEEVDDPLYEGNIYVDEKTFAIAGLSFGYSEVWLDEAGEVLVRQKPRLARLTPEHIWYEVRYRESGGKWFLDYVRNEIEMKVNWRKKLFNSRFSATTELVVTNKKPGKSHEAPLNKDVITRSSDLFSDKIGSFYDTEYWEDYSIIKPEDDLKKAISKIAKN